MARDHRDIGQELDLFMFSPLSPGCPIWLPKGVTIYNLLLDKIRQLTGEHGYSEVRTPILWKSELYKCSGHWEHYAKNMFTVPKDGPLLGDDVEIFQPQYALKPMNCPGHMTIFQSKQWSYRDLPVRFAEYGPLHRNEASGSLGGLTRCRLFCQDDAHCFVTPETLPAEVDSLVNMVGRVYRAFDMPVRSVLSTRPEKFMGEKATWDHAENILRKALDRYGEYSINEGDGAFYGPKIDFIVTDSLGREWQTATVQLDFQLPERFQLEYIAADNQPKRPIVVHRALYGSFERFIGILLEHYGGALPGWLSPVQVAVLPIADRHTPYAQGVAESLKGFRVIMDDSNNTLSQKIAVAQSQKIPFMVVVGDREEKDRTAMIRDRGGKGIPTTIDNLYNFLLPFLESRPF